MLEEIKKEIKKTFYIDENDMHFEIANINIDTLFKILDKYNNQPDYKTISQIAKMISSGEIPKEVYDKYLGDCPIGFMNYSDLLKYLTSNQPDYKSAWEELKQSCYCKNATYEEEITYDEAFRDILEELEQKYNLGGE